MVSRISSHWIYLIQNLHFSQDVAWFN